MVASVSHRGYSRFIVLVQDKQNGRVITVMDNRAAMTATRLAGGNLQGASVMQDLLTGGRK